MAMNSIKRAENEGNCKAFLPRWPTSKANHREQEKADLFNSHTLM